jgi:dihydroxycyclohexadiene carboxylate dehydrogenase
MIHPGRFETKVAVVTGAAQGIGRTVALNLAREGGQLALVDRSALVHEVRKHFGRIDIAIHNVGGTIWARPYEYYEEAQIEAEIRRSLLPTLWCCRAVLPYMLDQGHGTIVNVSSIATRSVNRVPYAAAKGTGAPRARPSAVRWRRASATPPWTSRRPPSCSWPPTRRPTSPGAPCRWVAATSASPALPAGWDRPLRRAVPPGSLGK